MLQDDRPHPRPPVAQLVTDQEWLSLSVETLFAPRGYAVLRSFNGAQALRRIRDLPPDLLVIAGSLRDMSGIDFCRSVRQEALLSPSTPILMLTAGPWSREEKLEALRAGVWDTCSLPIDGEELYLRLDVWVRAKLASDQAHEQGLLDAATGFYNRHGVLRRMAEVSAGAVRHGRPLACVVVSLSPPDASAESAQIGGETRTWSASPLNGLAIGLQQSGRASDTIGRISRDEFVIVAPDTDEQGAMGLAARLTQSLEAKSGGAEPPLNVRFGCYAVPDFREASIAPGEMLLRAAEALRVAQKEGQQIRFFSPLPEARN
jgi:PleD family two-component response regulator